MHTFTTTYCTYILCVYVCISIHKCVLYIYAWMHYSLAFTQPATGPSSVCEGSNVTLQCRVVFNDSPRDSVWYWNGTPVRVGNDFIPNHNVIF